LGLAEPALGLAEPALRSTHPMAGAADLDDESLLIVPKTNGHFYRQKLWWWSERSSFEMYQRSVLLYGITASPCSSGTAFLHCRLVIF